MSTVSKSVAVNETRGATRFEKTQVQALPLTKSPVSRSRTRVASVASAGGIAYLPTFLTAFIGANNNDDHQRRSQATSKGPKSGGGDYQLLAESEGLLSAFDEYRDNESGAEEDEGVLDLPEDTVINMRILNSSTHLVGEKKSRRKKLIWGGIIGAVLIAVIVVVVVLVTGKKDDESSSPDKSRMELNDLLANEFSATHFNGTFINDEEILYSNADGLLVLFNVNTRSETILVNDEKILTGFGFWVSPKKEFLLIARDRVSSYRHSFQAHYDVLDLATKTLTPITVGNQEHPLQYAQWNPVSNGILFVYMNNIYYKNTPTAEAKAITSDGSQYIFNGIPDWVYEEEVFASNCAMWFSPDGSKLAYVRFDDTPVRAMSIPVYGIPGSMDFQYTHHLGILYPKAGSPNPLATLHSVDLTAANLASVEHPYTGPAEHQKPLITAVSWIDNTQVIASWMNRIQNECYINKCTAAGCIQLASIKSTTGWVDLMTPPVPNNDGSKVAIIASQPQEGGDSFKHLTLLSTTTPDSFEALTKGKFVVTEILKWDKVSDHIFFLANTEANPEYSHLYVIKAAVGSQAFCLSCDEVDENNNPFSYFSATISEHDKNVIALSAEGPGVPRTTLYEVGVTASGVISKVKKADWESNAELDKKLSDLQLPTIEKDTIDLGNGFTAKVKMLLPPGLDRTGDKKYPMLVEVYGGPDSNAVLDRWSVDYGTYMASQKGVVYVKIDARGSGLRGDALMHQIYKKFGTAEIEDQTTTAKLLAAKYPFIDVNHMGIWGWSYGGYAAGMALAKDTNKVWQCAASVAPVTDWLYYDSIYTERYMALPSPLDNKIGYDNSRLSTLASNFDNKTFLLIHGTLDDNVHYQQAMALSRSLERNDIMFKQITYPDENHSLSGVRPHLYHSLTRYFGDCLGVPEAA